MCVWTQHRGSAETCMIVGHWKLFACSDPALLKIMLCGKIRIPSARSFRVPFPICGCIFAFICSVEDQALGTFCTVLRPAVFRLAGHAKAPGNDTGVKVTYNVATWKCFFGIGKIASLGY
jgi:hypothetical protein